MPPLRTLLLLLTLAPALAQPPATSEPPQLSREATPPAEATAARSPVIDPDHALPLNPTTLEARLRLSRIAREVAIRRTLRDALEGKGEPISDPEVAKAAETIRQHRAAEKMLSDRELEAAQTRLRHYAENTPQVQTHLEEATGLQQLVLAERLAAKATLPASRNTPTEPASTAWVPSPEQEASRLKSVAESVAARRTLREQAAGGKSISPAELEAARATLRRQGEIYPTTPPPSPEERDRREKAVEKEAALRRVMREAIAGVSPAPADPEVTKAIALLREEKTGEKTTAPAEIKAAYATLRAYAKQVDPEPATANSLTAHAERLEQMAAEVSIRRVVSDALKNAASPPSDPEAAKAAALIRAHELGEKPAEPDALASAHLTLRKYAEKAPANELIPHEELMAMAQRRKKLAEELATTQPSRDPDGTPLSLVPRDPQAEKARLEMVADEVIRRRGLREQAAAATQQSGTRARTATATPSPVTLNFPDADMSTVAALCEDFYPALTVRLAEGIRSRKVRLVFKADSEKESKIKFHTELRRQGIAVITSPDGSLTLDALETK